MRILVTSPYGQVSDTEVDDLCTTALDGRHYDRGELEALRASTLDNAKALGRMVTLLIERNLLRPNDIVPILALDKKTVTEIHPQQGPYGEYDL